MALPEGGRCLRCGWQLGTPVSPQGPWWACSRCKTTAPNPMPKFCPECGLDMRGPIPKQTDTRRVQTGDLSRAPERPAVRPIILVLIVAAALGVVILNNSRAGGAITAGETPGAAAAPSQCAIQRDGPPWDGPELIVSGPEGSCRTLQVSLSQMAVWDTVAPVSWSNGDTAVTVAGGVVTRFQSGDPVFVCGGKWNGLGIEVYYSNNPNPFHGDYGTQVCAALSLPGR